MSGKGRYIWLETELLNSDVFRSLSRWGILVFLRFMQKRAFVKQKHKSKSNSYAIANNGEIVFPYREAVARGISERAFRNALDELLDKGFLDIARRGKGGRSGDATLYFIDDRWKHYGTDRFQPPKKPRIKDTVQGRGWAQYNAKQKLKAADKKGSVTSGKSVRSSAENSKKRLAKVPAVQNGINVASP